MNQYLKKTYALPFILFLILSSCYKNPDILQDREQKLLQQYLQQNSINVSPTQSGLYFIPVSEGTGLPAVKGDYVMLEFTAQLIDGRIFDTTDESLAVRKGIFKSEALYGPSKIKLETLTLRGVEEGLLLMREGGIARLIIPSRLGYGNSATSSVPAYSTLIFDIKLTRVIKDPEAYEQEEILNYITLYQDSLDLEVQSFTHELEGKSHQWYYIELEEGEEEEELIDDKATVQIYYTGNLLDGRKFDSNYGKSPLVITLGSKQVVTGMELGLMKMKKNGKGRIIMPSALAYGVAGSGNKIPPWSPLAFDVWVIAVTPGAND